MAKPKITVKGIETELQLRILNFLNDAKRTADITGKEGIKIGEDVAQRILKKRATVGAFGFRDIAQLESIPGLNFDDLVFVFGTAFYGQFSMPYNTQKPDGTLFVVPHAALLRTGWVLFLPGHQPGPDGGDTTETLLWDPSDEVNPIFEFPNNEPDNPLYCSGHSFLSDGKLLAVGGGGNYISSATTAAWKYDPIAKLWEETEMPMNHARWYPTCVTLGGRRVLVASGLEGSTTAHVSQLEIYNEISGEFSLVTGDDAEREFRETYPSLHLVPPGGEIFFSRTGWGHYGLEDIGTKAEYFRFTGTTTGEWVEVEDPMSFPDRTKGMSVILFDPCYPAVRVMVIGGGSPDDSGSNTAEIVNLSTLNPTWQDPTYIPAPGGIKGR